MKYGHAQIINDFMFGTQKEYDFKSGSVLDSDISFTKFGTYVEIGLPLGFSTGLNMSGGIFSSIKTASSDFKSGSGINLIEFFVKHGLFEHKYFVISAQGTVKVPYFGTFFATHGSADDLLGRINGLSPRKTPEYEIRLNLGLKLSNIEGPIKIFGGSNHFLNVETAYRVRELVDGLFVVNELRLDVTYGIPMFIRNLTMMFGFYKTMFFSPNGHWGFPVSPSFNTFDVTSGSISFVYKSNRFRSYAFGFFYNIVAEGISDGFGSNSLFGVMFSIWTNI